MNDAKGYQPKASEPALAAASAGQVSAGHPRKPMPLPLSLLQAPASPNWSGVYQAVLCLMAVGGLGFLYLTRDRKS